MSLARRSRPLHRGFVWLLALLVPLQAFAAATVGASGEAHVHVRADGGEELVLVDPRRAPEQAFDAVRNRLAADALAARDAAVARHHHGHGDDAVKALDRWSALDDAGRDAAAALAFASFLPLAASVMPWRDGNLARHQLVDRPGWAVTMPSHPPLERPPR